MEAKVCVLLPVYNSGDVLAEVLDSILAQSYKDYNILVVDDASTDNTPEILKKYKSKNLQVLRFKEKIGIVNALNWSLSEVLEPYIIRADVHHLSAKDRFEKLVEFMDKHTDVSVCGSLVANNLDELKAFAKADMTVTWHDEVAAQLLIQNPLKRGSMIIRSSVLKKGYRLNDKYPQMEDYDLWYRMRNETKFAVINEPLVYHSKRTNGYNQGAEESFRSQALSFYLDKLLEFGIRPSVRELKVHLDISDIAKINKLSNPLAYKEWITKLKEQNQKVRFFAEKHFSQLLDKKWVDLFEVVLQKKNKRIIEYLQADGKGKLGITKFMLLHNLKKLLN